LGSAIDGGYYRKPKTGRMDVLKERACEEAGITRDGMLRAVIRQRGDKLTNSQKGQAATKTTASH
jgi:hypothetical protein